MLAWPIHSLSCQTSTPCWALAVAKVRRRACGPTGLLIPARRRQVATSFLTPRSPRAPPAGLRKWWSSAYLGAVTRQDASRRGGRSGTRAEARADQDRAGGRSRHVVREVNPRPAGGSNSRAVG